MTLSFLKGDIFIGAIILILVTLMIYNHRRSKINYSTSENGLNIKELIERVEGELQKTEQEKIDSKQPGLFQVKTFDLEVSFVVKTRYTEAGKIAGYDFIAISAENEIASEQTHKIILHLEAAAPRTGTAKPQVQLQVPDQNVTDTSHPPPPKAFPSQ
jgi:Trypsin-co-occurring domain 2